MALQVKLAHYMYEHAKTKRHGIKHVGKVHLVKPDGRSLCGHGDRHRYAGSSWWTEWVSPPPPGHVTCLRCLRKPRTNLAPPPPVTQEPAMPDAPLNNPHRLPAGTLVWAIPLRGSTIDHPGHFVGVLVAGEAAGDPTRLLTCYGFMALDDTLRILRFHMTPWIAQLQGELKLQHFGAPVFQGYMETVAHRVFVQAVAEGRFEERPDELLQCALVLREFGKNVPVFS